MQQPYDGQGVGTAVKVAPRETSTSERSPAALRGDQTRRKGSLFADPWKVAAVVTPTIGVLVLLVDGSILLSRAGGWPVLGSALSVVAVPAATLLVLFLAFLLGYRGPTILSLLAILAAVGVEGYQASLLPHGVINLRLDELVGPGISLGVFAAQLRAGTLGRLVARVPGLLPLGLFLFANLVPTVFIMHDHARGAALYTILLGGSLCYVGVVVLASQARSVETITQPVLLIGALEALFGLCALALSTLLANPQIPGVQIDLDTLFVEATGAMNEANIFGQFLVVVVLVAAPIAIYRVIGEGFFAGDKARRDWRLRARARRSTFHRA